jgi:hypothetical protein
MSGEDDTGNEGRSDRLRRRRSQRAQSDAEREPSAGGGDAAGGEASESATSSESSEQDETAEGGGVKSEQVGTYMYLPKDQKKELERLYNVLKAEYEYAYDADFEKNRHYYPLVIQYGIEGLDGLDASDIRERLASL